VITLGVCLLNGVVLQDNKFAYGHVTTRALKDVLLVLDVALDGRYIPIPVLFDSGTSRENQLGQTEMCTRLLILDNGQHFTHVSSIVSNPILGACRT
jgi:hypothetical protein